MIQAHPLTRIRLSPEPLNPCEHRTVSKDGRIVCCKVVEGDNTISPDQCRACPFQSVNCAHLRFSLACASSSPLIVRFNGRTEVWDDGPSKICFQQAACAARVVPVLGPEACAACPLRQLVSPADGRAAAHQTAPQPGRVVPFPRRQRIAAAG